MAVGSGCFGELGWLKELLGDRLVERSEDPLDDAPPIPIAGSVPELVAAIALMPVAGWCGWVFWVASASPGVYGVLPGIALAVPLLLGDRITRLAGLTYLTLLVASMPLAVHVSPAALGAVIWNGGPMWQGILLAVAVSCYWYEWRSKQREGGQPLTETAVGSGTTVIRPDMRVR